MGTGQIGDDGRQQAIIVQDNISYFLLSVPLLRQSLSPLACTVETCSKNDLIVATSSPALIPTEDKGTAHNAHPAAQQ